MLAKIFLLYKAVEQIDLRRYDLSGVTEFLDVRQPFWLVLYILPQLTLRKYGGFLVYFYFWDHFCDTEVNLGKTLL